MKALEEHGKQLVKEIFDELANENMGDMKNLSKQIAFNNLFYDFQGECGAKSFISFKGALRFYKSIRDGYTSLKKQKKIKKNLNQM